MTGRKITVMVLGGFIWFAGVASAETNTWTGVTNKTWSLNANWIGKVPVTGDSVIFNDGAKNLCNLDLDWTIASGQFFAGDATNGTLRNAAGNVTLTLATGGTIDWDGKLLSGKNSGGLNVTLQPGATKARVGNITFDKGDVLDAGLDATFIADDAGNVTTFTVDNTLDISGDSGSLTLDLSALNGDMGGTYMLFRYGTLVGTSFNNIMVSGLDEGQIYSVNTAYDLGGGDFGVVVTVFGPGTLFSIQ